MFCRNLTRQNYPCRIVTPALPELHKLMKDDVVMLRSFAKNYTCRMRSEVHDYKYTNGSIWNNSAKRHQQILIIVHDTRRMLNVNGWTLLKPWGNSHCASQKQKESIDQTHTPVFRHLYKSILGQTMLQQHQPFLK